MKYLKYLLLILSAIYIVSCDSVDSASTSGEWLIPKDQVFDGGPGRDGIPSIDNPQFTNVNDAPYLKDNDLVIGIRLGATIKAYPHPILDWHEIVNDELNGVKLAITYCPLTGSAIDMEQGGSGFKYNVWRIGVIVQFKPDTLRQGKQQQLVADETSMCKRFFNRAGN